MVHKKCHNVIQYTLHKWTNCGKLTVRLMSKPASSNLATMLQCPLLDARCSGDLAVTWLCDDDEDETADKSAMTVSMRPYWTARSSAVSDFLLVMWTSAWCYKYRSTVHRQQQLDKCCTTNLQPTIALTTVRLNETGLSDKITAILVCNTLLSLLKE